MIPVSAMLAATPHPQAEAVGETTRRQEADGSRSVQSMLPRRKPHSLAVFMNPAVIGSAICRIAYNRTLHPARRRNTRPDL